MKIQKLAIAAALVLSLMACAPVTVSGKVVDKYIENLTEYTLVIEDAKGIKHHMDVEQDDWNSVQVGQQYSQSTRGEE